MKRYFLFAFMSAVLAYLLYFTFAAAYNQLIDNSLPDFIYGFILHTPVWFLVLIVGGLLDPLFSDREKINRVIKYDLGIIIVLFLVPVFDKDSVEHFDYVDFLFYALDFTFCYLIFLKLLRKEFSVREFFK